MAKVLGVEELARASVFIDMFCLATLREPNIDMDRPENRKLQGYIENLKRVAEEMPQMQIYWPDYYNQFVSKDETLELNND